jgi:hypothetical protein
MSNDSKFRAMMASLNLTPAQKKSLIDALSEDISASDVRPRPPLLRQVIAASSGDHHHTATQKLMASASGRFAVAPVEGPDGIRINAWELRSSEKFKRLDAAARLTEVAKLRHAGAIRFEIPESE